MNHLKGTIHLDLPCPLHNFEDGIFTKTLLRRGVKFTHLLITICPGLPKIPKQLPVMLQVKTYSRLNPKSVVIHVSLLGTYLPTQLSMLSGTVNQYSGYSF